MQDVLQTLEYSGNVTFGNPDGTTLFHLNDRAANITFTWNVASQKATVDRHKNTAIRQEEQRIYKGNSGSDAGK